jgi:hypothetical protein
MGKASRASCSGLAVLAWLRPLLVAGCSSSTPGSATANQHGDSVRVHTFRFRHSSPSMTVGQQPVDGARIRRLESRRPILDGITNAVPGLRRRRRAANRLAPHQLRPTPAYPACRPERGIRDGQDLGNRQRRSDRQDPDAAVNRPLPEGHRSGTGCSAGNGRPAGFARSPPHRAPTHPAHREVQHCWVSPGWVSGSPSTGTPTGSTCRSPGRALQVLLAVLVARNAGRNRVSVYG